MSRDTFKLICAFIVFLGIITFAIVAERANAQSAREQRYEKSGYVDCCSTLRLLAQPACDIVSRFGPNARDTMELRKALDVAFGPCQWKDNRFVCEGMLR